MCTHHISVRKQCNVDAVSTAVSADVGDAAAAATAAAATVAVLAPTAVDLGTHIGLNAGDIGGKIAVGAAVPTLDTHIGVSTPISAHVRVPSVRIRGRVATDNNVHAGLNTDLGASLRAALRRCLLYLDAGADAGASGAKALVDGDVGTDVAAGLGATVDSALHVGDDVAVRLATVGDSVLAADAALGAQAKV